jgi:hypothetical protein
VQAAGARAGHRGRGRLCEADEDTAGQAAGNFTEVGFSRPGDIDEEFECLLRLGRAVEGGLPKDAGLRGDLPEERAAVELLPGERVAALFGQDPADLGARDYPAPGQGG